MKELTKEKEYPLPEINLDKWSHCRTLGPQKRDALIATIKAQAATIEGLTKALAEQRALLDVWGLLYNTPPILTGDDWKIAFDENLAKTIKSLKEYPLTPPTSTDSYEGEKK